MGYKEHKQQAKSSVDCAILTISNTRTEESDDSGKFIKLRLEENSHRVVLYQVVKDDMESIQAKIQQWLNEPEVQAIITNGGTGISRSDVTIEALSPLLEKRLDGFGELFRFLSYQEIGSPSMLSRAIAGVVGGKVIICLPGSLEAVQLAMEKLILPELSHLTWEAKR